MARSTRRKATKGKFRLGRRLVSPFVEAAGWAGNVGKGALSAGKKVVGAGVGFANTAFRSTGKRFNGAVGGLLGRKKTRRNRRNSRSQRR